MDWELHNVSDVECTMDDSDIYVTIHRVSEEIVHKGIKGSIVSVRADVFYDDGQHANVPLVSFVGTANAVRKHLIRWLDDECYWMGLGYSKPPVSREHASYIGYELHRAEVTENFVQD